MRNFFPSIILTIFVLLYFGGLLYALISMSWFLLDQFTFAQRAPTAFVQGTITSVTRVEGDLTTTCSSQPYTSKHNAGKMCRRGARPLAPLAGARYHTYAVPYHMHSMPLRPPSMPQGHAWHAHLPETQEVHTPCGQVHKQAQRLHLVPIALEQVAVEHIRQPPRSSCQLIPRELYAGL
jgi:hypothetical protein